MILLLAGSVQLNTSWGCEEAFEEFVNRFNKSYEDGQLAEARDNFCKNYATMLKLIKKGKCTHCGLTGIMDKNISQLSSPGIMKVSGQFIDDEDQKLKPQLHKQDAVDTIRLWWPKDLYYWNSIDLREVNLQGRAKDQTNSCGSCWAFSITAVLEGILLRDKEYGMPKHHPHWSFTVDKCNLSEQFIMSNVWESGNYCNGGDFALGIDYMKEYFKTVETAEHIPNDFDRYYHNWTIGTELKPKLHPKDYYIPFAIYKNNDNTRAALIKIFGSYVPVGKNPTARNRVKQLLSRGIPVCGAAHITPDLAYYQGGGIPHNKCPGADLINHQVVFVGYGKKNGVDVWLIRNSWGENWGDKGYFMVEQGRDSFCTEHYFYTVFPKYHRGRQDLLLNAGVRKTGSGHLDQDKNNHPVPPDDNPNDKSGFALSYALVIGSSLVAVCVCAIIAVAIAFVSRRKKRVYRVKQEQVYSTE